MFGCLADWLASKFGPKHIVQVDNQQEVENAQMYGFSPYKFHMEKTDEFLANLKRIFKKCQNRTIQWIDQMYTRNSICQERNYAGWNIALFKVDGQPGLFGRNEATFPVQFWL